MSSEMNAQLADVVAILHLAYAAYIVLALLIILIGYLAKWSWVGNRWFRAIHLAMIGVVVAEAWLGITCPLTTLEGHLRRQAEQTSFDASPVAQFVHGLLFYQAPWWVFTTCYTVCGLLIVGSLFLVPVCWRRPLPKNVNPVSSV